MFSSLSVLILTHLILIKARITISTATSCSDDHNCFPSGGRKCCLDKCSGRKYCENYCTYNGDCDISKQENCIGNKCTTEVRTLQPGYCRYSYDCDNLTEICEEGVCKKIEGVNGTTTIPKSGGDTNSGNSNSLTAVLVATIIPAFIVIALIFGVCFANYKIRALQSRSHARDEENIQTHQQQSEMHSFITSQTPRPRAPLLPPYHTFSGETPPSQAPPSYDDCV